MGLRSVDSNNKHVKSTEALPICWKISLWPYAHCSLFCREKGPNHLTCKWHIVLSSKLARLSQWVLAVFVSIGRNLSFLPFSEIRFFMVYTTTQQIVKQEQLEEIENRNIPEWVQNGTQQSVSKSFFTRKRFNYMNPKAMKELIVLTLKM